MIVNIDICGLNSSVQTGVSLNFVWAMCPDFIDFQNQFQDLAEIMFLLKVAYYFIT